MFFVLYAFPVLALDCQYTETNEITDQVKVLYRNGFREKTYPFVTETEVIPPNDVITDNREVRFKVKNPLSIPSVIRLRC